MSAGFEHPVTWKVNDGEVKATLHVNVDGDLLGKLFETDPVLVSTLKHRLEIAAEAIIRSYL